MKEGGAKEVTAVTRRTNIQRPDNMSRSDVVGFTFRPPQSAFSGKTGFKAKKNHTEMKTKNKINFSNNFYIAITVHFH